MESVRRHQMTIQFWIDIINEFLFTENEPNTITLTQRVRMQLNINCIPSAPSTDHIAVDSFHANWDSVDFRIGH